MAVGAGTVLDEDTAKLCVHAGARFLASPGFIPEVVQYANKNNIAVLPGALTPTEIIAAWKAGSDFVKIFPTGHVGGFQYVRALKIPLPQIPLIATGGVTRSMHRSSFLPVQPQSGSVENCFPRKRYIFASRSYPRVGNAVSLHG
jgi:2-dehydro-3-deoxyphosphogluconate aldolase/(4S)-4-hydroxy-2-oxoglutarate aldolase